MKTLLLSLTAFLASAASLLAQATFQLDKTSYAPGEAIVASWTGSTSTKDWVGIYPRGIVPDGDPVSTTWGYVTGASGSRSFNTPTPVGLGNWTAWLLDNDGYGVKPGTSPVDFSVVNPLPEVGTFTSSTNFASGSPVTLSWTLVNPGQVTSLTLSDGVLPPVDVFGQTSFEVSPAVNTTYTLNVNNGVDTATRIVMVTGSNNAAFSLDQLVVDLGQPVTVTWAGATANPDSWVGIYSANATPQAQVSTQWNYLNGTRTAGGSVPDGQMSFNLPVGSYFAVLFVDEGYTIEQGPVLFQVVEPVEEVIPVLSVVKSGNAVTIEWRSKAGHEYDIYASDTLEGDPTIDWETVEFAWPTAGDGTTTYTETLVDPAPARRFYKIYEFEVAAP
jgi:hypothetical protein